MKNINTIYIIGNSKHGKSTTVRAILENPLFIKGDTKKNKEIYGDLLKKANLRKIIIGENFVALDDSLLEMGLDIEQSIYLLECILEKHSNCTYLLITLRKNYGRKIKQYGFQYLKALSDKFKFNNQSCVLFCERESSKIKESDAITLTEVKKIIPEHRVIQIGYKDNESFYDDKIMKSKEFIDAILTQQ